MTTVTEPERQLEITEHCGVLVCGGGVAGISAALAAVREGADVRAAMKAQGFDRLTLECPAASEEAEAFWKKQGFKSAPETGDGSVITMYRDI